jgi:thymidylate kinase
LLPELLDKVTKVVADNLQVDKLVVFDGGDGSGLSNHVKNLTNAAVVMLEQMKSVTGIDLADLTNRVAKDKSEGLPKDLKG